MQVLYLFLYMIRLTLHLRSDVVYVSMFARCIGSLLEVRFRQSVGTSSQDLGLITMITLFTT